ncbi:MAG: hypothetical protein ACK4YF_09205 [Exilispira sp.]
MKKRNNDFLIVFLIFIQLILFLIFSSVSKYEPSIDRFMVLILSYIIGILYLFFSESKFNNFLKIYSIVIIFTSFTLRLGSLASSEYCIEKSIRLFYFLFLFSLVMNFLKQKENEYDEEVKKIKTNSVFIQSIFLILFMFFAYFTIERINFYFYTFLFFILFFSFLVSYRKFMIYFK